MWHRLLKDPPALAGMATIVVATVAAIAANEVRFAMHSARIGGKDIFLADPIHIPVHYEYVYAKDAE